MTSQLISTLCFSRIRVRSMARVFVFASILGLVGCSTDSTEPAPASNGTEDLVVPASDPNPDSTDPVVPDPVVPDPVVPDPVVPDPVIPDPVVPDPVVPDPVVPDPVVPDPVVPDPVVPDPVVPDPVVPDPDSQNPPSQVPSLTGIAYTDTEIELFWERATDDELVTEYQIWRDSVLQDTRDALSFFQNNLQPATTYEYEVIAIDNKGFSGPGSTIFITTPTAAPIINQANAENILSYLVSIINKSPLDPMLALISKFNNLVTGSGPLDGITFLSDETSPEDLGDIRTTRYICDLQGTLLGTVTFSSLPESSFTSNDCSFSSQGGDIINGSYNRESELSKFVLNVGISTDELISQFRLTKSDGRSIVLSGGRSTDNKSISTESISMSYSSEAFEGKTQIAGLRLGRKEGAYPGAVWDGYDPELWVWSKNLSAAFEVQSPKTGNKLIAVKTTKPFSTIIRETCFQSGTLQAVGADGSKLLLDAGNGDPASFDLTVTVEGISTTRTLPWQEGNIIAGISTKTQVANCQQ